MSSLITENLALWTNALEMKSGTGRGSSKKLNLYGIKKLRELILELAVRGKLVPQDSNDEPASVLLQRIAEEKAALVKEKKIKKSKALPEITEDEKTFSLPVDWEWVKLGNISAFVNGYAFKSSDFVDEGVGIVKIGDIQDGTISIEKMSRVSPDVVNTLNNDTYQVIKNDLLIAMSGATTGKLGINTTEEVFYLNQRVGKINPFTVSKEFLFYPLTTKISENLSKSMGSAIPNLSTSQINNIVIALPPLPEQKRIVAKVDELMALCDQLESQTESSIEAHELLVQTLLNTLTESSDSAELTENWNRIADHFETLFTTESSIDKLKQTVLQLAVMGKLVEQDPNDEPASVLLEKIADEKQRLVKEKVYQKNARLKPKENKVIYPNSWECVQTGELCPSIVPNRDKPKSFTGTIPWVTLAAFPKENLYLDSSLVELGLTDCEVVEYNARIIPVNSVLMSCVGRFGLTAINSEPVTSNQQIHGFIVLDGLLPEYLSFAIKVSEEKMKHMATSTTIAYLNKTNCESIEFGLPPLAEQHRIVSKVNQLIIVCDQLKKQITESKTIQKHFADAVVESVIW